MKTALYTNGDDLAPKERWKATTELSKELYDKFIECVSRNQTRRRGCIISIRYRPQTIVEFRTLDVWVDLGYLDCLLRCERTEAML